MTAAALALVLVAAVVHATWNLLSKRVSAGAPFVWLFCTCATVIYAPVAIGVIVLKRPTIDFGDCLFIAGTILMHLAYFVVLNRGYRAGDLSLVYPIARGTGPVLATFGAIVVLGERPTPVALGGALCIAVGVVLLTGDPRRLWNSTDRRAFRYALLTGVIIGCYTNWDAYTVAPHGRGVEPVLLEWLTAMGLSILLAPHAARHRQTVRALWNHRRREVIGVAIGAPLSYMLILTALRFSPVSYVAPAREISILFAALMGMHFLDEGNAKRRLFAASTMVVGLVALALSKPPEM